MSFEETKNENKSKEENKEKEKFSPGKERLYKLQRNGHYVFHGSPVESVKLTPQQAFNKNKETGEMEKHGEPAIFATPYADIAIFRALINGKGVEGASSSSFGVDGKNFNYGASQNLIDAAKTKIGKIYVFDKSKFSRVKGTECRCLEEIEPVEVIDVMVEDLPKDIVILGTKKS